MNLLPCIIQGLSAFLYGSSGFMKGFMFDTAIKDVRSSVALPPNAWMALGILEFACVFGLIVPSALRWQPALTVVAATIPAIESLLFIGVHLEYREVSPIILGGVPGLVMAFVAYGRMVLRPIL